ncbi:MAG: NAD-binding protein, partial [Bdellovibrionaceae bacterium]|nr:NAD-binding protein [Pseudobdellovibrionaceae bacterium]
EPKLMDILLTVVTLSMLTTPLVMLVYDRVICSLEQGSLQEADVIENDHDKVIIAGFGRFGQIIGRLLHANKITATVLDYEPEQINLLRRFGFKVYYGDATRLDLLEAAGIAEAEILIVAIDEVESNIALAKLAKEHYPHLKVFARARNIQHVFELMDLKVEGIERETFEASLRMGTSVLQSLGWSPYESVKAAHIFRNHNIQVNEELYKTRKTESPEFVTQAKQARDDLAKMFEEESEIRPHESSW